MLRLGPKPDPTHQVLIPGPSHYVKPIIVDCILEIPNALKQSSIYAESLVKFT